MGINVSNSDQETQEMLRAFVSEAFDSLDTNEPLVENLYEDNNSEYVNGIFRVFHTLKGLSGFFEMKVINRVTHEAETMLDIIRKENKPQNDDTISIIYMTFDFLRELLQRVNEEFSDKSGAEQAEDIILIIKDAISKLNEEAADAGQHAETEIIMTKPAEDTITEAIKSDVDNEFSGFEKDEDTFMLERVQAEDEIPHNKNTQPPNEELLTDDMLGNYLTTAHEFVENIEILLIQLEKEPKNKEIIAKAFGDTHSLKGNSGFMGFAEIEELAIDMETILDSLRSGELDVDETVISILLSNLEIIGNRLTAMSNGEKTADLPEPVIDLTEKKTPTVVPILENNVPIETPKEKEPSKPLQEKFSEAQPAATQIQNSNQQSMNKMQRKDIRVETNKIDKLFDLVGELITIESMVSNNPDLRNLELPNFNKSANMLNKITRELQEITMSVRMMPLEGLFNKMKRLVRDVSMKMGKKIDFKISGEDTEMDKNVIDEIADPLVHILRNAIDHGVESPEKRIENGKPEIGNVSLSARYEGNEILIVVKDDGAGIVREKILKKAEEKDLLTKSPELMTDQEVFRLLFEPGFSTAAAVTDISGRGVGMDVVKKNIEKLRGSIDIESVVGQGSTFILRIPLTLAIMEAMVIRIGNSMFALPILSVTESFKANPDSITETMDGLELIRVRNEVLPIIRLNELFNKKADYNSIPDGILITIESRTKKACLFADEIIGQQQAVIKSLTDYIGKVQGLMGCMILGDGSIGLIIDIESLINLAEIPTEYATA